MDDHHFSLREYARDLNFRRGGTVAVVLLIVTAAVLAWLASDGWQRRYQRVFEPLPGLLYAPPLIDLGLTTEADPVPLSFQPLDADAAFRFNASVPVSAEPLEAAVPFALPSSMPAADKARALHCLAQAVYYEAGSEAPQGQRAVAQVVLNRMRHPAFPSTVCGVVYSGSQRETGCQFTFTCDGALARAPVGPAWIRARQIAASALAGAVEPSVGQATHYHTLFVAPYWSPSLLKVANIGAHTFYRWKGHNGRRASFVSRYPGVEPIEHGRTPLLPDADALQSVEIIPPTQNQANPAPEPMTALAPLKAPSILVAPQDPATSADNGRSDVASRPAPAESSSPPAPRAAPTAAERPRRRTATAEW